MTGNFIDMHLKLFRCGCGHPNLTLDDGKVTCKNCCVQTKSYANPIDSFFDWRDNYQKSDLEHLEDINDEFEENVQSFSRRQESKGSIKSQKLWYLLTQVVRI